jgi:hypothetical protein
LDRLSSGRAVEESTVPNSEKGRMSADRMLFEDFARCGKTFYITYSQVMRNRTKESVDAVALASQLLALAKVGERAGVSSRTQMLGQACPEVQRLITTMIKDALEVARCCIAAADTSSDDGNRPTLHLTPIVSSFKDTLVFFALRAATNRSGSSPTSCAASHSADFALEKVPADGVAHCGCLARTTGVIVTAWLDTP